MKMFSDLYTSMLKYFNTVRQYLTRMVDWIRSISESDTDRTALEFLPAALEVIETPPAPLGRIILWVIMSFFVAAILWATFGEVDIVAVAQGKIVPSGRVKVIQPLETGVVKEIFVEDGQQVEKGQPLLELDSTATGADRERLSNELLTLALDRVRLKELLNRIQESGVRTQEKRAGIENTEFSIQKAKNGNIEPGSSSEFCILNSQFCVPNSVFSRQMLADTTDEQKKLLQQRFSSQYNEYLSRKGSLEDEVRKQKAEQKSAEERIAQLEATIPLITERTAAMKKMLNSGVVPRAQWLEVEEDRIGQVKELDVQKSNLNRLQAAVDSARQQLNALSSQVQAQWLGELNDAENQISAIKQELIKAEQRQTLQKLIAPVSGTVQQLAIHTVGGVVTPAQELMLVVPGEKAIEVEAWVQNKDIGFVEAGQIAEIKVETFPYTKYGVINGEIQNVSNDAVPNEQLGLVYIARVLMEKTTMLVNGKTVNLSPGMAVTVEVKIGKRRIIEYLLSPLLRYKEESIQER